MSLISYNGLVKLVEAGIINAPLENINGASIDITLGHEVMVENQYEDDMLISVNLKNKDNIDMDTIKMSISSGSYGLLPNQFILASSVETFNLPNNIACEYKLKSSLARNGLQHMLAGWCDPSWNNSQLTLELKNVTESHILTLTPGMKIGQMVFFECEPVPEEHSYAVKGQYNGQKSVTGAKEMK